MRVRPPPRWRARPPGATNERDQTMSETDFSVGDYVRFQAVGAPRATQGVVFRVTGFTGPYVNLDPTTGGRPVKTYPSMIERTETPAATVTTEPIPEPLHTSAVVLIAGPGWKESAEQLWIVTKVHIDGRCNVQPLGGSRTGRYFRNVPRSMLTVIDPARISVRDH